MAATLAQQPEVFSHFPHAHGDAYGDAYSGARADVGQLATSEDTAACAGRRATDGSAVRHRGRQFAKGAPPVRRKGADHPANGESRLPLASRDRLSS